MSLLLGLGSSVSLELSSSKMSFFILNFSVKKFGTLRHASFFKIYSFSLNTGMDCIPFTLLYLIVEGSKKKMYQGDNYQDFLK